MSNPIELYYWPTPNGWKITVALAEMGLPYRVNLVNIGAGDQFEPGFLAISPNNRIPAIVDPDGPDGPDGLPISVFESGAILQYLARKTGLFYGATERDRVAVDQWLMWQMGGVGPMTGQAHHFRVYAPSLEPPQTLPYAIDRYTREVGRLLGVLDRQLAHDRYVAGDFLSIADFAIWPWVLNWKNNGQTIEDKPNFARWLEELSTRPHFIAGKAVAAENRNTLTTDRKAQEILFKR